MQTQTSHQIAGGRFQTTYGRATRWALGYLAGAVASAVFTVLFITVGEYMGVMLGSLSILCLVFGGLHLVQTEVAIDRSSGKVTVEKTLGLRFQRKTYDLGDTPHAKVEVHEIGSPANVQRRDHLLILEADNAHIDVLRTHDRDEALAALESLREFVGLPEPRS